MPTWPKHYCAQPGCRNLVERGKSFCEEHQKKQNRIYERYERKYDPKKRYDSHWSKISARYRAEHPLCELCFSEGKYVKADLVHHKVPIEEGGTHDEENLQALCSSCHSRLHAERGERWRTGVGVSQSPRNGATGTGAGSIT